MQARAARRAPCTWAVALAAAWAGCFVTIGDFDATPLPQLAPGATSRRTVDSLFGEPRETAAAGGALLYRYLYSDQDPRPNTPRIDRKLLLIEFVRDTLNGFLYSSSVGAATTDFPDTARESIIAGRSTSGDVRRVMGEPTGRARIPTTLLERRELGVRPDTVPAGSHEAWLYAYAFTERNDAGGYSDVEKQLVVFFDSTGSVTGSAYHGVIPPGVPWCCPSSIRYRLEKTSCVTVELYDITGFLLQVVLRDEEQTAGSYMRTIEFGDLPSAVYYVRIGIDGSWTTQRILLMK